MSTRRESYAAELDFAVKYLLLSFEKYQLVCEWKRFYLTSITASYEAGALIICRLILLVNEKVSTVSTTPQAPPDCE